MAAPNLSSLSPQDFPHPETTLESLTDAYQILDRARTACASLPAMAPFRALTHARDYIAQQADALITPLFELPPSTPDRASFIESTLDYVSAQLEVR